MKVYNDGRSEPTVIGGNPGPFGTDLRESAIVLLEDGTWRTIVRVHAENILSEPDGQRRYVWVDLGEAIGTVPIYITNESTFWYVGATDAEGRIHTRVHVLAGKKTIGYFDDPEKARTYLQEMGLGPDWSVREMDTRGFLALLRHYVAEGITHVAWNPGPGAQMAPILDLLVKIEGVGDAARRGSDS